MLAKLLALVLPLGLDTFAVATGLGTAAPSAAQRRRLTLLFCTFEAGMPLVGLAFGAPIARAIGGGAQTVAALLVGALGIVMLLGSDGEEGRLGELGRARGAAALALGLSVSLDELAIGFALGLLRLPVALVLGLIAAQAVVVTQLGLRLGRRLGETLREGAERLAGLALLVLGVALLLA